MIKFEKFNNGISPPVMMAGYSYDIYGRFINEDPIGLNGGLNLYAFVHNNPILNIDPFGYESPGLQVHCRFFQNMGKASGIFLTEYHNMREANTIGADKYFHCMANCLATRVGPGGYLMSIIISQIREFIDHHLKGDSISACTKDQEANRTGRNAAKEESCKKACQRFRPGCLDQKY